MKIELLIAAIGIPVGAGIWATRIWVRRRRSRLVLQRLERLVAGTPQPSQAPATLLKQETPTWLDHFERSDAQVVNRLRSLLVEAGCEDRASALLFVEALLIALPLLATILFGLSLVIAACASLILSVLPFIYLNSQAESRRAKLSEQLPDAIDLMIAVLRSGHSVPESVKAVAAEIPDPCGDEFRQILQRMNLGQSLSEALVYSTRRFRSFELDLIRRAVAIQSEVGGSLADLFESTNATLRGRLKLARQLKVITAQSRLSAYIVGLLPIVLAVALNTMSPGYLQILFDDPSGRMLLALAVALECAGLLIMHRMSVVRG